jgi:FtsH-binding integral membrane protein
VAFADRFSPNYFVYQAPVDERVAFIRRTYLHLAGAVGAFVLLSWLFFQMGVGATILQLVAATGWGWMLILGGFMLVGWLASSMAHSDAGQGTQYVGLGLYTLAEALIFSPMIYLAARFYPSALPTAAVITLVTFGGLSLYVVTTRKDFSFLRTALFVGGLVALGAIVLGAIFGFNLGVWFSAAMILFACGAILYTTSRVLHEYRSDQHVAAALELFAAVALLFWYVLRILMQLSRSD